ncbi:MAG: 1-acyl-sn-glycerol-3-phosphate acyltransferase [Lachnospiraceae bacterium]|nr:1-acyl-sn-glycerol-3-phosphate acyltransferase [Lachnospiraceae bacterium]
MKIRTVRKTYDEVAAVKKPEHIRPMKPSPVLRAVMKLASMPDLKAVDFSYEMINMERAGSGPWLILMNHSSFLDLEIASHMIPMPYNIVCTSDGLVGKEKLMRHLGCIPTQKFVTDVSLITDLKYALHENHTSVLMYPEASYSFDGTATRLPRKMGVLFKALKVPVVMITTYGSFARDPLYNMLQKRKVKVSAKMECLLSHEEVRSTSVKEIDDILDKAFSFDYFKWQADNGIRITEPFRADGLNRILYKCPHCLKEGDTEGMGTTFVCHNCGALYDMDEYGRLSARAENTVFSHIPDWYAWERACVREELEKGSYSLDTDVEIGMIVDYKALYMVGSGTLHHDVRGFSLTGCDGKLEYEQPPVKCYSCYSDYFWYEIGDVICIGDKDRLYYCFPTKKDVVAKTRIATEELYRICKASATAG